MLLKLELLFPYVIGFFGGSVAVVFTQENDVDAIVDGPTDSLRYLIKGDFTTRQVKADTQSIQRVKSDIISKMFLKIPAPIRLYMSVP